MKLPSLLVACTVLGLATSASAATVFEKADAAWRPADSPRASDVVMRSLQPRPMKATDPRNSIEAAEAFHVTRHEWTYLANTAAGGNPVWSQSFVNEAHRIGVLVGGAGSGATTQVKDIIHLPLAAFAVLDINGNVHVLPHKRGWAEVEGEGSVFSEEYFQAHLKFFENQLALGCDTLQRDEGQMATNFGFDFSPAAINAFRAYLKDRTTEEQRNAWHLGPLATFDVRKYFLQFNPPSNGPEGWFLEWKPELGPGNRIKDIYNQFITDGCVSFFQRTRGSINAYAGRTVPMSCNNTSYQRWGPTHRVFDWGMSEMIISLATPKRMYDRVKAGREIGKVQVLSMPKTLDRPVDPAVLKTLNRKVIAQAYAIGAIGKVPWDLFLQSADGEARDFGEPSDYADLFGFVRGIAPRLEGFEEAAVASHEIADTHGWDVLPLRLEGGKGASAFLRVRPGDSSSPVVIHIVNWGEARDTATISVLKSAIGWAPGKTVTLLQPAAYNHQLHVMAEYDQNSLIKPGDRRGPEHAAAYAHLVVKSPLTATDQGEWITLPAVTAAPWSVIVIE